MVPNFTPAYPEFNSNVKDHDGESGQSPQDVDGGDVRARAQPGFRLRLLRE